MLMKNLSLCVIFITGLLLVAPAHADSNALPPGVRLALDNARIPVEAVAAWSQSVDQPAPTLAINASAAMNPASVMKLVTAFAALERLGPAHTWTTRIAGDGPLRAGVLEGNLYLVGGADPVLGYDRLWKILRRLRA